ncbi:Outer membrane lipoprotein Blc [BD1-7 clade bacterium]|uniref:Outer membrane lipoprotein Blc n=1 Tax=BD1-7 clade bacterium TaxID=2029982 RepID=A0A5S9Q2D6_9GAMM|nr:Outer membrane lipoprotein Blc [BD1-7 clade bacterium]CAA0112128.1 Outer membrane lipoprotein Blc [BD1-7 clade bacterium]
MKRQLLIAITALTGALLTACTGIPKGVEPVKDFSLPLYLGTWYEIARLDHSFERGMSHVTAEYSMRDDGGVRVINRGYLDKQQRWKEAEGKAYFVNNNDTGYLKVSFFGPFYGAYVVFDLEPQIVTSTADQKPYQLSYVSGPDTSYLWLLSRTPEVDDNVIEAFKQRAASLGFDANKLIRVDQSLPKPPAPTSN